MRTIQRRWMTVILLLLGVPMCLLATFGIVFVIVRAMSAVVTPPGRALFASDRSVLIVIVVYINLYIAWTWMVLKRKARKCQAGFEVLPPKL